MEYNSNCLHQDLNILTSAVHVCLLGRNSILAFEAHHAVKRVNTVSSELLNMHKVSDLFGIRPIYQPSFYQ